MVEATAKTTRDAMKEIVGAVFGKQGQSQDVIPQSMRRGEVKSEQRILYIPMQTSGHR